ncbi:hypothetical protein D1007_03898 [Hordeum vulgare]|nr:hypothetical protein D1007_03898 [Hordeum vulgare]
MSGPVVHKETTSAEQRGFVTILANLIRHVFSMEEHVQYVVYEEDMLVSIRHFWATVNSCSFYYYHSHEGYGRSSIVASKDQGTDPALLHLVCYIRAQEALYEEVTLDLIAARGELAHLNPRRREAERDASNQVVLFGRPIESLRSTPAADPNHAPISPKELHRILGISSNGTVSTTPRDGHHRYPSLVALPSSPSNPDVVVPAASTSAIPAHLDVNEVD